AQVDAREGGHIQLRWNDAFYMSGTFRKLEPNKRLVFTWDAYLDPAPTLVTVTFKETARGTQVTVARSGLGANRLWAGARNGFIEHWPGFLENLKSLLETGIDLRFARRPRLGIGIDEFSAEIAKQIGVPISKGVRLSGTVEGTGARAAGLQKDDVLIALNGKKLTDWNSFGPALAGLKAGDKPKVAFYRGAQKQSVALELSKFPSTEVPATGAELAAKMLANFQEIEAALTKQLEGLTEEQAGRRPKEKEWSVKELLAHYILMERDYQSWVADMLNDQPINDDLQMRPNVNERLQAVVSRFPTVAALRAELSAATIESAKYVENFPAHFVQRRQHLYRRAALWQLEVVPMHFYDEHGEQLKAVLEAVK
ncbi:MAG: SRPBCC domain-containing protein, partial [Anaerolineales bacterium]|nr:SRPBCC domain-containing protein [Anaerolineales bacterium]